jgi:hypothetical protein
MPSTDLPSIAETAIGESQRELANTIRRLLYRVRPDLVRLLDFYDDDIFLEPLLFAYFNAKSTDIPLEQLLYGYIADELKPKTIPIRTDGRGTAYLPNVGYSLTGLAHQALSLRWSGTTASLSPFLHDEPVAFSFEPIRMVRGTAIEICRDTHPLFDRFYAPDGANSSLAVEAIDVAREHTQDLDKAFRIISRFHPEYYKQIRSVVRKIVLFAGEEPQSFATIAAHGVVFLNAMEALDEVFFVEDLLHQCGHVVCTAITLHQDQYFLINTTIALSQLPDGAQDSRTVYETFHGVFTETHMSICLNSCYEAREFQGRQHHELSGRLALILIRFATDLRHLSRHELFTDKGLSLYASFRETFERIARERTDLVRALDLSNQPYAFSYEKFCERNPASA